MTASSDLLGNLVEGSTYRIGTTPLPDGRVRWSMALYETIAPETAQLLERDPAEGIWNEVGYRETEPPPAGAYRASAVAWLAERDPAAADCILILPDGNERIGAIAGA